MSGLVLTEEIVEEMIGGAIPAWVKHAACRDSDPNLFFPEQGHSFRQALAICDTCPVQRECLDHALVLPEPFGIWGGTSERERRRIKRRAA